MLFYLMLTHSCDMGYQPLNLPAEMIVFTSFFHSNCVNNKVAPIYMCQNATTEVEL